MSAFERTKVSKFRRDEPRVSFVVPVLNDAARLTRCLRSIVAADYPRTRIQIIVVDNGSIDGSARVAADAGAAVLVCESGSVGELRNRGAALATGEILAFIDADHEIVPEWIPAAVDALGEAGVGAVGALCMAPSDGTWVQRHYDQLRGRTAGRREVNWLGSGNMAVRRDVFERAGRFSATLATCEDVDLCHRIRAAGVRVISDDRLRSVHFGDPATLGDLFRSELWRGRHNLRISLQTLRSLRDLPSILIPILDLIALAAGVAGLVTLTSGGAALAAGSAAVVLGLSLFRVARMRSHSPRGAPADCARAVAVACTYDLARALALVTRAGHRRRVAVPISGSGA